MRVEVVSRSARIGNAMRNRWIEWKSMVSAGLFVNGYVCLVIVFYMGERVLI
jgi:hypothetical protein